ncbi:VPA1262 family N-terminal domain-containing protein [Desulfonema magnum]|nr:VPA1262 family N-terminal domain-containing protein [Desulfonema magnum]
MPISKVNMVVDPQKNMERDYDQALIHLAWNWDKSVSEGFLIFGMVELFPKGIALPSETAPIYENLGNYSIGLQRFQVSADEAIKWYKDCRQGLALELKCNNPRKYKLASLSEEPAWPNLTTVIESDLQTVPFLADWHCCPRLHHLIPIQDEFTNSLWNPKQKDKALKWLSDHLFFNFKDYPELLGSIHLIAPNPIFRDVDIKGIPSQNKENFESALLNFYLWPSQTVKNLKLTVRDIRPTGAVNIRTFDLSSPKLKIDFGHEIYKMDISVTCPHRGVLFWDKPMTFIRSIRSNISIRGATRKIILEDENKGSSAEYETDLIHPVGSSTIGSNQPLPPALKVIIASQKMRQRRSEATRLDQHLFRDQTNEAEGFVKGIIRPAKKRVLIVDPYFTTLHELIRFGLAPHDPSVLVQILTSAKGFKLLAHEQHIQDSSSENQNRYFKRLLNLLRLSKDKFGPKEFAKIFDQFCREFSGQTRAETNKIAIKVMTGKKPDAHDRFLAVDNQVWLIGSSLNKLGRRLTAAIRFPDPGPVRNTLETLWKESEELQKWIEGGERADGETKQMD